MGIHNQPNFRNKGYVTEDVGRSRTAFWESEATVPQDHAVHLERITAAKVVSLPANSALRGEIVLFNNSSVAITANIGTAAAGTQYGTIEVPANSTRTIRVADTVQPSRAVSAVHVGLSAYPTRAQGAFHAVFYVRDYPPVPNGAAVS